MPGRRPILSRLVGLAALSLALVSCTVPPDPESFVASDRLAEAIRETRLEAGGRTNPFPIDTHPFARVFDTVRASYVRPLDDRVLVDTAIRGMREDIADPRAATDEEMVSAALHAMLASLDPYSAFLDRGELRDLRAEIAGRFGGLGIRLTLRDGVPTVVAPLEGTPADRAGIEPNDRITHADDAPLTGIGLPEAIRLLRGRPGTEVVLTVERDGEAPRAVTITRDIITLVAVEGRMEGDIGYIRVRSFTEGAAAQVERILGALREAHGPAFRGAILDLRGNPGGLLSEAVATADLFLEDGLVVYTRSRRGGDDFDARRGDILSGLPVAVLIDEGSASASEIVAGALQDNRRGILLGAASFGKGSVQKVFSLPRGMGVKLTTELYYTPLGRTVDGGIEPDLLVAQDEARAGDEVIDTAVARIIGLTGGPDAMWNTPVQAAR